MLYPINPVRLETSLYNLGVNHYYGYGVVKNYKEAMKWLRSAAEERNSKTQLAMGIFLRG